MAEAVCIRRPERKGGWGPAIGCPLATPGHFSCHDPEALDDVNTSALTGIQACETALTLESPERLFLLVSKKSRAVSCLTRVTRTGRVDPGDPPETSTAFGVPGKRISQLEIKAEIFMTALFLSIQHEIPSSYDGIS